MNIRQNNNGDFMKILKLLSTLGKSLLYILFLFFLSIVFLSISLRYEKNINPFCLNNYEDQEYDFNYDGLISCKYNYSCSTIYFYLTVDDSYTKDKCLSLILSIASQIQSKDVFSHFQVTSNSITMFASVDLSTLQISYVGV